MSSKLLNLKERSKRIKTMQTISKSQHVIKQQRNHPNDQRVMYKTVSQKKILPKNQNAPNQKSRHLRSLTTNTFKLTSFNPYEKFVRDLDIVLPTPKQKFYEFMEISPFNRTNHHLELIHHFLKQYKFFKNHPSDLLDEISKKIKLSDSTGLESKLILVVESGQCIYHQEKYQKGDIIGRNQLNPTDLICSPQTKFIIVNRHQYQYLVSSYLDKEKNTFRDFLTSVQIFKMFPKKAFDKFIENLTLSYFCAGQYLYRFGQLATHLYIVYKGKASRKVIVQVDKINKIPMLKYSKIVKILSKSYEHKIQFEREDLIGIAQVIDHIETRKQNIHMEENCIVLGLQKSIFQENLDEYIVDRLRKYNLRKYPVTYDKLCQKFQKDQIALKQQQKRKIEALKGTITKDISQKKSQKIHVIIKKYQQNIKKSQILNLIQWKIQQRKVQRE